MYEAARGGGARDDGSVPDLQQQQQLLPLNATASPARLRPESRLMQVALLPQFSQWLQDVNTVGGGRRRQGSSESDPPLPAAAAEAEATEFSDAATGDDADVTTVPPPPPLNRPREAPGGDDQSAADELHALLRRGHHSLPFVGLLLVYFAYQHTTGLVVFFVGSVAMLGLDQRLRAQIALKDKASELRLLGIVAMCAVDMFALCCVDGDPNPLRHFARSFQRDAAHDGVFWDVLWTIVVNGDGWRLLCARAVGSSFAHLLRCCLCFFARDDPARLHHPPLERRREGCSRVGEGEQVALPVAQAWWWWCERGFRRVCCGRRKWRRSSRGHE